MALKIGALGVLSCNPEFERASEHFLIVEFAGAPRCHSDFCIVFCSVDIQNKAFCVKVCC